MVLLELRARHTHSCYTKSPRAVLVTGGLQNITGIGAGRVGRFKTSHGSDWVSQPDLRCLTRSVNSPEIGRRGYAGKPVQMPCRVVKPVEAIPSLRYGSKI